MRHSPSFEARIRGMMPIRKIGRRLLASATMESMRPPYASEPATACEESLNVKRDHWQKKNHFVKRASTGLGNRVRLDFQNLRYCAVVALRESVCLHTRGLTTCQPCERPLVARDRCRKPQLCLQKQMTISYFSGGRTTKITREAIFSLQSSLC